MHENSPVAAALFFYSISLVPEQIRGELHLALISNQNTVHLQHFAAYTIQPVSIYRKTFPPKLVISKLVFYEELYQMLSENLNK